MSDVFFLKNSPNLACFADLANGGKSFVKSNFELFLKHNYMQDRSGLLSQIASGAKLKKTVTNDRSAPIVAGRVFSFLRGIVSLFS